MTLTIYTDLEGSKFKDWLFITVSKWVTKCHFKSFLFKDT